MQNQNYQIQINKNIGKSAQKIFRQASIYSFEAIKFFISSFYRALRMAMGK